MTNTIINPDFVEVLPPAESFEVAHVAHDYPYGRLRTDMFYYIEYREKFGYRPVTRSINPKNDKLNKPHAGNYYDAVAIYKDTKDHLQFAIFSTNDWENKVEEFHDKFFSGLPLSAQKRIKYWYFIKKELGERKSETLSHEEIKSIQQKASDLRNEFFEEKTI